MTDRDRILARARECRRRFEARMAKDDHQGRMPLGKEPRLPLRIALEPGTIFRILETRGFRSVADFVDYADAVLPRRPKRKTRASP